MENKLKCYEVIENYSGYTMYVFSETASKARYLAFEWCDEIFEGTYYNFGEFIRGISIRRFQNGDNQYRGHHVMDWCDNEDRLFLVKECGWACCDETDIECDSCVACEYCDRYEEWLKDKLEGSRDVVFSWMEENK